MPLIDRLFSIGPVRQAIWRLWYPYLTRRLRGEDVRFLNYAFETDPPVELPLEPADEADRGGIQLYHHLVSRADLRGREVLEVSCGHGGGASWVCRTLRPHSYTGLDLNAEGIRFCEGRHRIGGLRFVRGDAQHLPFPSGSFDAVINLEASHCYPDFPAFLSEAVRVLRPGGHFLYADFRIRDEIGGWLGALASLPMERIHSQDISADVLRGMALNAGRSLALVRQCLPPWLHSLGRDFAGVPHSRVYDALQSGELSYRSWSLRKNPVANPGGAL